MQLTHARVHANLERLLLASLAAAVVYIMLQASSTLVLCTVVLVIVLVDKSTESSRHMVCVHDFYTQPFFQDATFNCSCFADAYQFIVNLLDALWMYKAGDHNNMGKLVGETSANNVLNQCEEHMIHEVQASGLHDDEDEDVDPRIADLLGATEQEGGLHEAQELMRSATDMNTESHKTMNRTKKSIAAKMFQMREKLAQVSTEKEQAQARAAEAERALELSRTHDHDIMSYDVKIGELSTASSKVFRDLEALRDKARSEGEEIRLLREQRDRFREEGEVQRGKAGRVQNELDLCEARLQATKESLAPRAQQVGASSPRSIGDTLGMAPATEADSLTLVLSRTLYPVGQGKLRLGAEAQDNDLPIAGTCPAGRWRHDGPA